MYKMKVDSSNLFKPALFLGALLFCFLATASALAEEGQKDNIFGGQILSLTDKKEGLEPSNDPRYQNNQNGTVTDLKEG